MAISWRQKKLILFSPLRMTRRLKLLASKEIRLLQEKHSSYYKKKHQPISPQLTSCGHVIVERISMSKRKPCTELSLTMFKKPNTLKDFVYHMALSKGAKVYKISPTKNQKTTNL